MAARIQVSPSQHGSGQIYVPTRIVKAVPPNPRFEPELTDEGLLYRFVGYSEVPVMTPEDVPEWAKP